MNSPNGDYLTINAQIPETVTEEENNGKRECRYGRFSRAIRLNETVEISFEEGVLRLNLSKAEAQRAYRFRLDLNLIEKPDSM